MRTAKHASTSHAAVFTMDALGGKNTTLAIPVAQHSQPYKTSQALDDLLIQLSKHDDALAALLDDANNTSSQRSALEFMHQARATLGKQIAELRDKIAADRQSIADRRKTLLSPPAVTHAVEAQLDAEIRARVPHMQQQARDTMMQEMGKGMHERALLGLARDPLPGEHQAFGARTWQDKAKAQHAKALAQLDDESAGIDELATGLDSIAYTVDKPIL